MSQSTIIDKILNSFGIFNESKIYDTPENVILIEDEDGNGRNQEWHYCLVIGQMNYLAETTIPDIILAANQCAKYSIDKKIPRGSCQKDWTLFKEYKR